MNQKPNQLTADDLPAFDAEVLLGKCGIILQREVRALMAQSAKGKLAAGDAKDLVNYVKLQSDIKIGQDEALRSMTDEELKKAAK